MARQAVITGLGTVGPWGVGIDGLRAALAAGGHALTEDTSLPGVRRGYVDDPFGNRIELVEAPESGA